MKLRVALLAVCMLLTGSLNTIATKLQDNVVVGHDAAGQPLRFKHPLFQTAAMFTGEALCLVPFVLRRWYKAATRATPLSEEEAAARAHRLRRAFWVFSLPALCDAAASTLLNLGLFYTYASVFQMLRGTLVIFAGLLTILLLKRSLHSHHWLGMVLICAGAALVGASSVIYDRTGEQRSASTHDGALAALASAAGAVDGAAHGAGSGGVAGGLRRLLVVEGLPASLGVGGGTAPDPLLGNILVVVAQLLAATQFIVEEKYLVKYRAPVLLAVGMEGFWGVLLCCLALPAMQRVSGPDGRPLDSIAAAIGEVRGNVTLQWTTAATVISIAFFNFFGVSVTKNLSGAARATIDACRTLFIWLFALRAGWENFHMLQVVGFVVLLSGTSVYNEILRSCLPAAEPRRRRHHHHAQHGGVAEAGAGDAEPALQEPLLQGSREFVDSAAAAAAAQQKQAAFGDGGRGPDVGGVCFAPEVPASRPIAAGRQHGSDATRARYTMARSVTILPAALSPHSLASVPSLTFGDASFTFSIPHNFSRSTGLGGGAGGYVDVESGLEAEGELEDEGDDTTTAGGYSESEISDSDTERVGGSQHGPPTWMPRGGRSRDGDGGSGSGLGSGGLPPPPAPQQQ